MWYILGCLVFKDLLFSYFKKATREIAGVLASKIILRIYGRSFFEYLVIKNIAKDLKVELGVGFRMKGLFNSFILLLIREKT